MSSLLRNWRETELSVRIIYFVVAAEAAFTVAGASMVLAGLWSGF